MMEPRSPRELWSATPTATRQRIPAIFASPMRTTTSTTYEAVVPSCASALPTSSSKSLNSPLLALPLHPTPVLTHECSQYYDTMDTGLNSRMRAQALIQSSVFTNVGKKAIFSESSSQVGYVVVQDVVLGGESVNTAPVGTLTASSFPYTYTLLGSGNVAARVPREAGQILTF